MYTTLYNYKLDLYLGVYTYTLIIVNSSLTMWLCIHPSIFTLTHLRTRKKYWWCLMNTQKMKGPNCTRNVPLMSGMWFWLADMNYCNSGLWILTECPITFGWIITSYENNQKEEYIPQFQANPNIISSWSHVCVYIYIYTCVYIYIYILDHT